ncbi:phosphotransferase [Algoriphagus sp. PAP.12]|uniref:phosphotransferase n=1 Tax=Algoriphagus sp. PAP.12 TaxID=2996678 RepID=UPI00227B2085|nr:phosphotransferase [Algoriphagus sp. PAP.12]
MNFAPAISTIISPDFLAQLVGKEYNLQSPISCKVLKTGVNHTYLIESGEQKFVFRLYCFEWKNQMEIEEELRFLKYLNAQENPVSIPVQNSRQEYLIQIPAFEGMRFGVLFSYAEGKIVRNPDVGLCEELGGLLAKIHSAGKDFSIQRKDYNPDSLIHWAWEQVLSHFSKDFQELDYFKRACGKMKSILEAQQLEKLQQGVIHLDVWYENFKVSENGKIHLFDFDNVGKGYLFLDVGYALMILFKNEPDKVKYIQKQDAFLKGYRKILPFSQKEMILVPFGGLAIWLYYTGIHVKRYNDFANLFLSEEFLKFWIHTVDQWMKFNGIDI